MEVPADAGTGDVFDGTPSSWWDGGNPVKIGDTIDPEKIDTEEFWALKDINLEVIC